MRPCREGKISPKQISFILFLFSVKWRIHMWVLQSVWRQYYHHNKLVVRILMDHLARP
jgi:hypothetical protein